MTGIKFTSPGVLLILAVTCACGIFLLDWFYLRPNVDSQKNAALRDQAMTAQRVGTLVMQDRQESLLRTCAAWGQSQDLQESLPGEDRQDHFAAFAQQAFGPTEVELAWVTDGSGNLLSDWTARFEKQPGLSQKPVREAILATMRQAGGPDKCPAAGLLPLAGKAVLYSCQPIGAGQTGGGRFLWMGQCFNELLNEDISSAMGGSVVFVAADNLPLNAQAQHVSPSLAIWTGREDALSAAWSVRDAAGKMLGYFQAQMPSVQICRNAASARRMTLITLSLSMGLALMVIIGTHILITGPVVRLLKRLQGIESGQEQSQDLVRDLHGEPLMLARRLESAFDRLATMSKTDQLTGLANRRHFQEVLECFYTQARRYNRPLSLIVLDVDFFKAINDTGGHQVGDDLLRIVAGSLERACRKADLPCRYGGDEFAVLLPETAAKEASAVAERIRSDLAQRVIEIRGLKLNTTISAGITDLNSGEGLDSPDALISFADKALYAAKEMGRNRIVLAHDLNGLSLEARTEQGGKVNQLCKKLAGLDEKFRDLFLRALEEVMEVMAHRNPDMADHAHRVQHFAVLIAREVGLSERVLQRMRIAATMHDIGMIAMPDAVLLNPGQLSEEQLQIMRKHPLLSVRIMEGMEFLEQEIPAVRYHHERYDGKGYPEGISGAQIPLTARVLAVADSFDAMTSPRAFRKAMPMQDALMELKKMAGTQFDPAVVDAFLAMAQRMGESLMEAPGRKDHTLAHVAPAAAPAASPAASAEASAEANA